jgi:hypothetical protein
MIDAIRPESFLASAAAETWLAFDLRHGNDSGPASIHSFIRPQKGR